MIDYMAITREQLGKGSKIGLDIVDSDEDLFYRMAIDMFDGIAKNNREGKTTVLIVPVGPVRQYRRLAMLINRYKLSLKKTYIFNMDEYLDDKGNALPPEHPLSFQGTMLREFYNLVDEDFNVPASQRYFPTPANIGKMWDRMQALGGVDVCYGGIGINGHVAFNEPPESGEAISDEEFFSLPGRVLKISRETRTINSTFSVDGLIDAMPEYCVTIGMRDIFAAKKIRLYLARDWQRGIIRKVLHGPVTAKTPASLLQRHPDARITICEAVAAQPIMR
jgi:glucosamine-6-phosphate deaminase